MEYAFNGHANESSAYPQMVDPRLMVGNASHFGSEHWPGSGSPSGDYQSSATFGGAGYRSPLRHGRFMREMNSRNGLYSPLEQTGRSGGGTENYHTSLPGPGAWEAPTFKPGNTKSPW